MYTCATPEDIWLDMRKVIYFLSRSQCYGTMNASQPVLLLCKGEKFKRLSKSLTF